MCMTCGCGHDEAQVEGESHARETARITPRRRGGIPGSRRPTAGPCARRALLAPRSGRLAPTSHAAWPAAHRASRIVRVERDILAANDAIAAAQPAMRFEERGIFALNLVSSPGSGKTTLLVRTIERARRGVARRA